ncbi:MAG: outer membrane lipoprotein-sorting protein [Bradymonadia bacterium]|jgi:hypothetical protein
MSRRSLLLALVCFVVGVAAGPALAQAPDAAGLVAKATARNGLGFDQGQARVRMQLTDSGGARKERVLRARTVRGADGTARTLLRFLAPAEVQGAAFLLVEQKGDTPDDMHLYLPALKRTRRISGAQKDGSFMGSDFSYADMENRDVKSATYAPAVDEAVETVPCWKVEARSSGDGPWGRLVLWIRKDNGLIEKSEFRDTKDTLVKVYRLRAFATHEGALVATEAEMTTVGTGNSTRLSIDELDTRTPQNAADFTPENLSRG